MIEIFRNGVSLWRAGTCPANLITAIAIHFAWVQQDVVPVRRWIEIDGLFVGNKALSEVVDMSSPSEKADRLIKTTQRLMEQIRED